MAQVVGSVTANLVLDSSEFTNGITTAMRQLQEFKNAFRSSGGSSKQFTGLNQELEKGNALASEMKEKMGGVGTSVNKVKENTALLNKELEMMTTRMSASSGLGSFNPLLGNTATQMSNLSSSTRNTTSSISGFNTNTLAGVKNLNSLGIQYNTTNGKLSQFSNGLNTSNTRLTDHWNKLYRVTSALHSLKVVLTTVSSMFIWTFGMSLWEASKQTLNSKNEMESYLVQMGKTSGEIRSFNQGLDETVDKFRKLNKYMIGETIAGIGMEFNLSTGEMKKAMNVVAMIQNEYVRAGRKESEASLAVKDILQGEFLRLSRETGVGKQDLIDTGKWKGDLKDITGLMEALEVVGKARHWDQFASKCRSLNDVISKTKNRISEFTATLIDDISPAIITAFNWITDVIDGLTESFNNMGVFEKIMSGVPIFFALSGVLMLVAGNVNLLDIAMYGYRNSLIATILQVDVATVKELGLRGAIVSKITSLNASTVAEMGNWRAIATRLLGLDASIVKEYGLKTAIATSVAMKKLDSASTTENTGVKMINNTTTGISSSMYTVNTAKTTENTVAKNVNSGANLGVLRTLVVMVTGLEAETVATMSATSATWAFITSVSVLEAITLGAVFIAIASAVAVFTASMMKSADTMKKYNDILSNSDTIIQQYKDSLAELRERESALQSALNKTKKGTAEYNNLLDQLTETSHQAKQAQEDLKNAIEGIEKAQRQAKKIENARTQETSRLNRETKELMKAYHYEGSAIEQVNNMQWTLQQGYNQKYRALQIYAKQTSDQIEDEKYLLELWSRKGSNKSTKERIAVINELADAYQNLREHSELANTSDDGWERFWNKLYAGLDQWRIDWILFWEDPLQGISNRSIMSGLFDVSDWLKQSLGLSTEQGDDPIFSEAGLQILDMLNKGIENALFNAPMEMSINISDWLKQKLGIYPDKEFLFDEEFQSAVMTSISNFFNFLTNALMSFDLVNVIVQWLNGIDNATATASQKGDVLGQAFGIALGNTIRSIPIVGQILSILAGLDGTTPTAQNKGHKVGSAISQGVKSGSDSSSEVVKAEMFEITDSINASISRAYSTAQKLGSAIVSGINSMVQHHSPGIPAQTIRAEMFEIEYAMDSHVDSIYQSAQNVSNAITSGIQPNTNVSVDGNALNQYQTDSQLAMGLASETVATTEGAFNELDLSTALTFANIGTTIGNAMTNIATNTKSNYNNIAVTTKSQLANMQSETTKNINQIKTSWRGMQTALIQSAENIRSETSAKIHSLQSNMGQFWRKVQNPALLLGAGSPSEEHRGARPRRFGGGGVSRILRGGGFAGSPSLTSGGAKATGIPNKINTGNMSIKMLDALDLIYEAMLDGKPHYFGGWNFNWSKDIKDALMKWHTHFGQIYDPYLYVGKFENDNFPVRGIPEIARNYIYDAISRTSYEFYYDSKYGSPLASWNAGHFNCYDGALLVLALANAFGFSGHMVHGSWAGIPHVWAYINGIGNIDSTAIQGGYGLTAPSRTGSAGGLVQRFKHNKMPSDSNGGNTINGDVNIYIDGADKDSEEIGREVRNVIIDLMSPSPSTGQ